MPHGKAVKHPHLQRPRKRGVPGERVKDPVDVRPIRVEVQRVLATGQASLSEIAERAGYVDSHSGRADTSRLQRRLGLKPESPSISNGVVYDVLPKDVIGYKHAVAIVRAIDGWPVDFGL